MLQRKGQPVIGIMAKSIYPTYKQSINKRQSLQPNQIFLTDFSDKSQRYDIKKKRCLLFLINKAQKKKNSQNNSVFTNQGILFETIHSPKNFSDHNQKKNQSVSKNKANSFIAKKQTLSSAFNFTRTFTPKKIKFIDSTRDFAQFHLYPQGRYLQSAQTDRQKIKIDRSSSNKTYFVKQKLKSQGNQGEIKQIGAWRTIDVEFQQLM